MAESLFPGEPPVSLDEVREWLRLGTPTDDAVIERLIDAATNICEAFIGGRLIVRAAEEVQPIGAGPVRLRARPVVAVDAVTLLAGDSETVLQEGDYRVVIASDGRARLREVSRSGWRRRGGNWRAQCGARLRKATIDGLGFGWGGGAASLQGLAQAL